MSERLVGILLSSFTKILIPGIKVTIPLTILSFAVSLVLGLILALVQVARIRVLKEIAFIYIWIFRGWMYTIDAPGMNGKPVWSIMILNRAGAGS